MKPFDLEKALAGEPVVTRDGQPVTQITKFEVDSRFPIAGVINGDIEYFTDDGRFRINETDPCDLFMASKAVKKEGWINVYTPDVCHTHVARTSHVYGTEREARSSIVPLGIYIATIKIEWEEEI